MAGVFGSPATRSPHDDSIRAEPDNIVRAELDIEKSVDGTRPPNSLVAADNDAWACIALNTSTKSYGYGLAATQAAALARARSECASGGGTCNPKSYLCVSQGCVAYAAGDKDLELHASAHQGSLAADRQAAQSLALSNCQSRSNNCRSIFMQCTSGAN
jgi:hypothetical protein